MKRLAVLSLALAAVLAAPARADAAFDADAAWRTFLANGDREAAYSAYDILDQVGYQGATVDAERCSRHRADVDRAVATVPVSIAVRRAAFLCAQARKDDADAERQMEALAALSRLALAKAGDPATTWPIRVMAPADAVALIGTSGLEMSYGYYASVWPARYQPLVVVAWDAQAKIERHYVFDFIDVLYTIERKHPYAGNAMLRHALSSGLVNSWAQGEDAIAIDLKAVRDARQMDAPALRAQTLRVAARKGGLLSASTWLLLCAQSPFKGCDDDLVDVLLSGAEQKQALPMLLLAFAHARGIGVERDPDAAMQLLDGAQRLWPLALPEYVELWAAVDDGPLPPALQTRLDRLAAQGSRFPQRFAIARKVAQGDVELSPAEIAFLADPAENGNGAGYDKLGVYFEERGPADQRRAWLEKGAAAGAARSQAYLGSDLIYGDLATRDPARGERLVEQAAQGGQTWAMRHLAERERMAGRWSSAQGWLAAAMQNGDTDAALDLADLFAAELPGVTGKLADAVELYRSLSDEGSARARRSLASLALEGTGMKKDPAQARQWLAQDAERGDTLSQTELAMGYLRGDFGAVDEKKGEEWIQRALQAKEERAYNAYGGWLYHRKHTPQSRAQAIALWLQSIEAGHDDAYNELAWASCTSPFPDSFDAARGMSVAEKMGDPGALDLPEQDTVAACYAATGRFREASDLQARAVARLDELARADKQRWKPMADDFRVRLALYKAGRAYLDSEEE
ncbi:MAG TPA: tetratricopeptide repeat protein [Lysobacter sp.]